MREESVTIQAPASSANCGPGFDCLGIALSLYNFVRVRARASEGLAYVGEDEFEASSRQMVKEAAEYFWEVTGIQAHGLDYDIWGEVPAARGLGSSSTLRGGIVAGLNEIHKRPLDKHGLSRVVGHLDEAADGACAMIRGGFCCARIDPRSGEYIGSTRFDVASDLAFVVIAPDFPVKTAEARAVLPAQLPFEDVVKTINSLAHVVSCFARGKYTELAGAVDDFVHQPYRSRLNAFVEEAIAAGVDAGAYTGWLSGSGSSVLTVAPGEVKKQVGRAMLSIYESNGIGARLYTLSADNVGLRVAD